MAGNPFTKHLHEVGETYPEHLAAASRFGLMMVGAGLACFVHGIFPFLFERKGSETVKRLNGTLCKRVDKPNWERHPII